MGFDVQVSAGVELDIPWIKGLSVTLLGQLDTNVVPVSLLEDGKAIESEWTSLGGVTTSASVVYSF